MDAGLQYWQTVGQQQEQAEQQDLIETIEAYEQLRLIHEHKTTELGWGGPSDLFDLDSDKGERGRMPGVARPASE